VIAKKHQGDDALSNLAWACHECNLAKSSNLSGRDFVTARVVRLFNPRRQRWSRHFAWEGAMLLGLTPCGRATIDVLNFRPQLSLPEQDYLDVLGDLVEAYEDESIPMRPVGDAEMLRFLIEKGISQAQAASGAGVAPASISEVLAGKRKLTRLQVGKLAKFFHVEPGVFQ